MTGTTPLLALLAQAHAFCGTYVGDGSAQLTNHTSELAIARVGTTTVLTMRNDVQGEAADFGMIVPVPPGMDEDDIRLAREELFTKLRTYSAPRLVDYTCEDFYELSENGTPTIPTTPKAENSTSNVDNQVEDPPPTTAPASSGCSGGSSGGGWVDSSWDESDSDDPAWRDTENGVDVEEEIDLGEYTVYVLAAEGSEGLMAWLEANGFQADAQAQALFEEYIAQGSEFLALKINLESPYTAGGYLTPLQIRYQSATLSLPLRMGAGNSAGVQDLVIYSVNDHNAGRMGINNYPEATLPADDCMVEVEGGFANAYEGIWTTATGIPAEPELIGNTEGFAWTTEYAWGSGKCDPCTEGGPLEMAEVEELGMSAWGGWFFTRLHLRYTPRAVTQDVQLYTTGIVEHEQQRYVQHRWELESLLPSCEGLFEDPGECYSAEYWARRNQDGGDALPVDDSYTDDAFGCARRSGALSVALPLLLLLGWRRRR